MIALRVEDAASIGRVRNEKKGLMANLLDNEPCLFILICSIFRIANR